MRIAASELTLYFSQYDFVRNEDFDDTGAHRLQIASDGNS